MRQLERAARTTQLQRTNRRTYPKVSKVMNPETQAAQATQIPQATQEATINTLPPSQTELPSLIVLASQSPRRKELLLRAGISTYCIPSHINETKQVQESQKALVERLAREKLLYVYDHFSALLAANAQESTHATSPAKTRKQKPKQLCARSFLQIRTRISS